MTARLPRPDARTRAHLTVALVGWPLLTAIGTAIALTRLPYYALPAERAVTAAFSGVGLAAFDVLVTALVAALISRAIFRRAGDELRPDRMGTMRVWAEPVVAFLAAIAGTALWYPALLSVPVLGMVAELPAGAVVLLLAAAVVAGAAWTGRPGRRARLAAMLLAVGLLAPLPLHLRSWLDVGRGTPPTLAIVGLDSLSHADPIEPLRQWTSERGGVWYERAVAPGLLTNAVWASILTGQPVRSHGVFHAFQALPAGRAPLLDAAARNTYRTIGRFSDQLTAAAGAQAGFDEDRSGLVGWRQMLLPIVADNSMLIPLVRPVLPDWWPSSISANQTGTYTYDLRREVRAILRSGRPRERTMVAAHLTYTHLRAYPRSLDMTRREFERVWTAPAGTIRDRSFDWQDKDRPEDPIPLRQWKVARLQQVVAEEVDRADLAGSALVLFSDHGERGGLTSETFGQPRYHHVLLATFGLAPRCPSDPISLIDIGSLTGLTTVRAEPAVEFVLAPPVMWPRLVSSARLQHSGQVILDQAMLDTIFADLRKHEPWPAPTEPCDAAAAAPPAIR